MNKYHLLIGHCPSGAANHRLSAVCAGAGADTHEPGWSVAPSVAEEECHDADVDCGDGPAAEDLHAAVCDRWVRETYPLSSVVSSCVTWRG